MGNQGVQETSRLENFPLEQWDLQIAVGLKGAFLCSPVFGSAMAQDGKGGVFNGQGEEFVQRLSALIPLGRMAKLDEYHSAVQFLCSEASAYMNGQNIVMDGGRSTW